MHFRNSVCVEAQSIQNISCLQCTSSGAYIRAFLIRFVSHQLLKYCGKIIFFSYQQPQKCRLKKGEFSADISFNVYIYLIILLLIF